MIRMNKSTYLEYLKDQYRFFYAIAFLSIGLGLVFEMGFANMLNAQSRALGTWEIHSPYMSGNAVTEADGTVYVGSNFSGPFSFKRSEWAIDTYTSLDGFAEVGVNTIRFSKENNLLLIAYDNSNIDLLKNGKVVNMPDIKDKLIVGDKSINDAHFIGNTAWLCTGFGIVLLDLDAEEIKDTYYIGPDGSRIVVNAIADDGQRVMAATELGIFYADLSNPALFNFNNWNLFDESNNILQEPATDIVFDGQYFYATMEGMLHRFDTNTSQWSAVYEAGQYWDILDIAYNENFDKLVLTETYYEEVTDTVGEIENTIQIARIVVLENEGTSEPTIYENAYLKRCNESVLNDLGDIYVADNWFGLIWISNGEVNYPIQANGPKTDSFRYITIDEKEDAWWLTTARLSRAWTPRIVGTGAWRYKNGEWKNFQFYNNEGDQLLDIINVLPHSNGKTYIASFGKGLVELESDEETYTVYDESNSSIDAQQGNAAGFLVNGLTTDAAQNLWMTCYAAAKPISVKTPDGEWMAFDPPVLNDELKNLSEVVTDDFGHLWFVCRNEGIMVMDPGEEALSANKEYRLFKRIDFFTGIPSNDANCIVKDLDGEIWVGTDGGIATFFCTSDPFSNNCEFSKPIIIPEGSTQPVFVLDGAVINSIAVDGADRKWLGTNNGVLLLSPDGKETLLNFTKENSPLLSNLVYDVAINNKTGEVFFVTSEGVATYQGDAIVGNAVHSEEVLIYPNPVYPDYDGDIAIKGLANNAIVKITDLNGQLVYETEAFGGQAVWDGRKYNGERPKTGVYLILSSTANGLDSFAGKVFFVE